MSKKRPPLRLDPDLLRVIGSVKAEIPLEKEKEMLRELTLQYLKQKYGLEDLDEQERERLRNRLRKLIEMEAEKR